MKFLIADDHPIFRTGVRDILLSSYPETEILLADDGDQAIQLLIDNDISVAVLDVDMPEKDGLETAEAILEMGLDTRIVILTMFKDYEIYNKAKQIGVHGFLLKEHSGNELMTCIDKVLQGERYTGKGLEEKLEVSDITADLDERMRNQLLSLTQAETKTLKLVSQNLSSKEIAERLFVTPKSIENYRSRICKKLEIPPGNNSLIKWALEHKDFLKDL